MKRIVLITGAGTGIGKVCAHAFMRGGHHVIFTGRREDVLCTALEEGEGSGEVFACDIGNATDVEKLFNAIEKNHGRIDVLFNNAGIFPSGRLIDEISVADWQATVDINLTGSFLCARAAFALMRKQEPMGGRIINNGSIAAISPRPLSVAYSTTKHAITGLTKSISLDGREFDIVCSQIDIGNAASDMTMPLSQGAKQADGSTKGEPLMDLEHVADAVRYIVELPLSANVQFMTLMASKMPFIGRG